MFSPDTGLLGLILAVTLASLAVTGWLSYRSLPSTLKRGQDRLIADVGDVRHDWKVAQLQFSSLIEGLEDLHDRVKRAKAGNRAVLQRIETPSSELSEPGDRIHALRKRAGLIA